MNKPYFLSLVASIVAISQPLQAQSGHPVINYETGAASAPLNPGEWAYFEVTIPANREGLELTLTGSGPDDADLYLRQYADPTTSNYLDRSLDAATDRLFITSTSTVERIFHLGVHLPPDAAGPMNFTIEVGGEFYEAIIPWDDGLQETGTAPHSVTSSPGGSHYFKIVTEAPDLAVWRAALTVNTGEADLYVRQSYAPSTVTNTLSSTRTGNDGFTRFLSNVSGAGQIWYLLVKADAGASFDLIAGDIFVDDLGTLAADSSSGSGSTAIPPEGARFFRTSIPSQTLAWRLWLQDAAGTATWDHDFHIRKGLAPHESGIYYRDKTRFGQGLLVPDYIDPGGGDLYYVGVFGEPGQAFQLDSRQQEITDIAFDSSTAIDTTAGFRFRTYRIPVPVDRIAWQVGVTPASGNPNLAIRREKVPNPFDNDGFSDVADPAVTDSLSIVPPGLSDGNWYVTTYSDGDYSGTLSNGEPVITQIGYATASYDPLNPSNAYYQIINDDPDRAGWRYFAVSNVGPPQLGSLAWLLELENQVAGTEIAIRRNFVPGRWHYRQSENSNDYQINYSDQSSATGFLQDLDHESDIWYVGIYTPDTALGNFTLKSGHTAAANELIDGGGGAVNNLAPKRWSFHRIVVPDQIGGEDVLGWQLRVDSWSGFRPEMVVRRDSVPKSENTNPSGSNRWWETATWPTGNQWNPGYQDWTGRFYNSDGTQSAPSYGMWAAMGKPLEPGTYYVGFYNPSGTEESSFTFSSKAIGEGMGIEPQPLAYDGGSADIIDLPAREVAYYTVDIPTGTPSWRISLSNTLGESALFISRDRIPDSGTPYYYLSSIASPEVPYIVKLQRTGDEHYTLLPAHNETTLAEGRYYLMVVSEGQNPSAANRIGTGSISAILTSHGLAEPSNDLGTPVLGTDQTYSDNYELGRMKHHTFTVPAGVNSLELSMENRVGNPTMYVRYTDGDSGLPNGGSYGYFSGYSSNKSGTSLITLNSPPAGSVWRLTVIDPGSGVLIAPGSYTLRIRTIGELPLTFDGGTESVAGVSPQTWRFFKVTVPDQIGGEDVLGWQLRVDSWSGYRPEMVIRRDSVPQSTGTVPGGSPGWWQTATWPTGNQWNPGYQDWTGRPYSPDGTQNAPSYGMWAAMGKPLESGTYYVGFYNPSGTEESSFTFSSKAIGEGMSIETQPLAYAGGSTNIINLPAREIAYYTVDIPAGTPSWRVSLSNTLGESALFISKDRIPDIGTPYYYLSSIASTEVPYIVKLQRTGDEHYTLLPASNETTLAEGRYYLMVVSEGQNPSAANRIGTGSVSATLTSHGAAAPSNDLGTPVLGTDLTYSDSYELGRMKHHTFTVPAGVNSLELSMENLVGNPTIYVRYAEGDSGLPRGGSYGYFSGSSSNKSGTGLITLNSPPAGSVWRLTVMDPGSGALIASGSYTLRIRTIGELPLTFDGGTESVADVSPQTWRFFKVTVPDQIGGEDVLGWQLRVDSWSGYQPTMVVRRDAVPQSIATIPNGSDSNRWWETSTWPTGNQWNPGNQDWTGRAYNSDGTQVYPSYGMWVAMGKPLEPGTYYIGFYNPSGTEESSFTFSSKAIGEGMSIAPQALAYDGGFADIINLPAREVAYYTVDIPSDTPSWRISLSNTLGESSLFISKDRIPDSGTPNYYQSSSASPEVPYLVKLQRTGDEHYTLLPARNETFLAEGRYYLMVVSEGQNPSAANRIGTGSSSATLNSHGPATVMDLGTISPGQQLTLPASFESGRSALVQFTVLGGVSAVETKIENRIGNPSASLIFTQQGFPAAGTYGLHSGYYAERANFTRTTIANPPPGTYRCVIMDQSTSPGFIIAGSCDLVIRATTPAPLNFSSAENANGLSHTATGILADDERAYFQVEVPTSIGGDPVIGWQLELNAIAGNPEFRVMQGSLPDGNAAPSAQSLTRWSGNSLAIVPPVLNPGTWFVEVRGEGSTEFVLTSQTLPLERDPWSMPALDEQSTTPGLSGSMVGDTGIDVFGDPLPGDQGINLENGDYHYYAIDVPEGNIGLLRTQLQAISGNPDLYIRQGGVPTLDHTSVPGGQLGRWVLYNEKLSASSQTEYGNFVPYDGKTENQLAPGRWYFAVQAAGTSNARYRLVLSAGSVQDLPLDGGLANNQTLAAGDWGYYRFTVPDDAPTEWTFAYSQQQGDVDLFVRDTIPPGTATFVTPSNGYRYTYDTDWLNDNKTSGTEARYPSTGSYTISPPLLRPGTTYYLGFKANSDAVFDLASSVSGTTIGLLPEIAFAGGSIDIDIPAGERRNYRVVVPSIGKTWIHTSIRSSNVELRIEQGSLPASVGVAHHRDATVNGTLSRNLSGWPWIPGQTYYVSFTNLGASEEPLQFSMQGESLPTYATWAAANGFPVDPSQSVGDANGNGIADIFDYGLERTDSSEHSRLPSLFSSGDDRGLVFRLPAEDRSDLILRVFHSEQLIGGTWTMIAERQPTALWTGPASVTETPKSGGTSEVRVLLPDTENNLPNGFLRLGMRLIE